MKNPKGKGSGFEREVAKKIVKAFRKFGIHQRECWRSTLSGGHMIAAGDLAMSDKLIALFPYACEIKFYKKIHWWHLLIPASKKTRAWKEHQWLVQAVDGSKKRIGLLPLLIMKENHGPTMAAYMPTDRNPYHKWAFMEFKEFLRQAVDAADIRMA